MVCWSKNAQKEERLADPGSRGEDSDGVEGEDESESEKRRGVPSLRERLPMSAGLGVGELRARLGVWFGSVVALDGAVRDDIDLERIDANVKKGGFIFPLPLIVAGITAAATEAGATACGVSVANENSGSGKTHLTFNMLTTPNLLVFDSLYIYTTTPEQSYYQFLKALEYLPKKDVQEVEIKDIIDNYIEGKNPTDI
ncbi:hypothetical protein LOTGIDRAFT_171406 [Lottia gigantea]|uniref:Uncharacterized protein n=1 Tax=Lottia gigantea TaxID=225164 RepID=V4AHE9_LOTGI|nr:hypothetical protein LOTGIDRAFT_171406 [Lottia gigantea]ESP03469.1 hypothetical protein LOTGIDRAFT_171406 [Lottia gigantea]